MKFLDNIKDKLTSITAKFFLSSKFERYGKMLDLNIDSFGKNIHLKLQLKGEDVPITIKIIDYHIVEEEDKVFIQIKRVESSKEWVSLIAEDLLIGKKIELPKQIRNTLKMFL
jgi:hypothetical protein